MNVISNIIILFEKYYYNNNKKGYIYNAYRNQIKFNPNKKHI